MKRQIIQKQRARLPSAILLMLLSILILGSCDQQQETSATHDTGIFGPSDKEISAAINKEYLFQDGVYANDVEIATADGIVTLEGMTDNILAKERMVRIAQGIRGVKSVIDRIEVAPTDLPDADIEEDITNALLYDPATEEYEVDVEVTDGDVHLTGTVQSLPEKRLAEIVVSGVRGVRRIDNDLNYNLHTQRSDLEIEQDIEAGLRWDIRVDDDFITVQVQDGTAILTGHVGSAAEKTEAELNAWVNGVTDVNVDGLAVKGWAHDDDMKDQKFPEVSDAKIHEAVTRAFLHDPRVYSFEPEVQVNDGEVTLSGVVSNLKARHAAELDAENTVGVWSVVNNLKVEGIDIPDDVVLKNRLEDAIRWNSFLDKFEIAVNVNQGVVTLRGAVDNFFEKYKAQDVAASTGGVLQVNNELKVDPSAIPYAFDYDRQYYIPYTNDRTVYAYTPSKTDEQILEDVKDQLWWSAYVDEQDVEVSVNNGQVTLDGSVDSWNEYYQAEKDAFEGGALSVKNELLITRS